MRFRLAPDPQVTPEQLASGKHAMVQDAVWASIVTSALIPPLALLWRAAGALRYRVCFA